MGRSGRLIELGSDAGRTGASLSTPRIVHVSQPVDAGVATVVAQQAALQQQRGWQVTIVSPAGWLQERSERLGIKHVHWEATREPGSTVPEEARQLGQILRAEDPDLVHLHSSKAGLAGRLSVRGQLPTIFQPHAWSFQATSSVLGTAALSWERWAAHWTDLTICCSEAERRMGVAAKIQGMSLSVGNGVDLGEFIAPAAGDRAAARVRLGIPADVSLAVCVGRLQQQKGQEVAVAAWERVRVAVPGARLLLVGGGPDEADLRALAGDGVSLVGPTSHPRDYFLAADVCLLPSRWEGLSLALLEGMACARSTVATDVPGCREVLLDGDLAGEVVSVGNPEQLAVAVIRRLRNPELAASEGLAGRMRIENGFTTGAVAARLRVAYDLIWRLRRMRPLIDLSAPELQTGRLASDLAKSQRAS
jgi:glycosyltransferase involved in cell wall biosynthesis